MSKLFRILPEDFFKPFTSKYKQVYADCILLMFHTFKPEISYGVNREVVIKELTGYFEADDDEMSFDDETYIRDAREKANGVVAMLKSCGWIEYEQEKNHQLNVVLYEYTIPIIEALNRVIKEEETEYQGIISQIHASLQNQDLYIKPYELIIKGITENSERLISELKKLNVSIKRHMDKQTAEMDASEIIEHFFEYQKNIGSKAYLRMKTSENIFYFRNAIIEKIEEIMESASIMERAQAGYMEIEQEPDKDIAYDAVIEMLLDVKSRFYHLDDIIAEIDRKHTYYLRNVVMRARFKLATGNNIEGKLERILDYLSNEDIEDRGKICSIFEQKFLSPESLQTIPVLKKLTVVDDLSGTVIMTEEERLLYKEALRQRNRTRFSRKNINAYVEKLLEGREKVSVEEIPIHEKKDLIRIVYISLYAGNRANIYSVKRSNRRVKVGEFEFPYFEIVKR